MIRPLDQQVVVVTGASSGIGKQTARRFAEAGSRVVIAARRGELLEDLAEELEDGGHTAIPVVTDVTDAAQMEALVAAAIDRFEYIDTWVNCAGAAVFGRFEEIPAQDFARELEVVLMSQVQAARTLLPIMRRQGQGTIINVASLYGRIPVPMYTPYVTAEFALIGFSESLRQELRDTGIAVCTIVPGWVDTPFFDHARGNFGVKPRPLDPVYAPDTVARAIVRCARHPRRQQTVGLAVRSMELTGRLFPGLTERRMARLAQEMHDTRTALPFVDALYQPTTEGQEARGGWGTTRERFAARLRANARLLLYGAGVLALGVGAVVASRAGRSRGLTVAGVSRRLLQPFGRRRARRIDGVTGHPCP